MFVTFLINSENTCIFVYNLRFLLQKARGFPAFSDGQTESKFKQRPLMLISSSMIYTFFHSLPYFFTDQASSLFSLAIAKNCQHSNSVKCY